MEKIIVAILTWVGDAIQSIFGMIVAFWTSIISGVMIYITRAFLLLFEINDNAFFGEGNTDIIPKMIRDFTPKFRTVAFSVLILIATWHIFKGFFSFLGLGTEPEEAWKIGLKCIMFGILLTFSNSICSIGLQVFDEFVEFTGYKPGSMSVTMDTFTSQFDGMFESMDDAGENDAVSTAFRSIGFPVYIGLEGIISAIKFIMLIIFTFIMIGIGIDFAGKYLKIGILIIVAPISFACGVTKATNQIFNAWVKSYIGSLVSVFIKYFLLSQLSHMVAKGMSGATISAGLQNFILLACFMTLIKQSDSLVNELGFTAGMTPNGPSSMIGQVIKTTADTISGMSGKGESGGTTGGGTTNVSVKNS